MKLLTIKCRCKENHDAIYAYGIKDVDEIYYVCSMCYCINTSILRSLGVLDSSCTNFDDLLNEFYNWREREFERGKKRTTMRIKLIETIDEWISLDKIESLRFKKPYESEEYYELMAKIGSEEYKIDEAMSQKELVGNWSKYFDFTDW